MRLHRLQPSPMRRQHLVRRITIALCTALLLGMVFSYLLLLRSGDAGAKKSDFVPYYSAARLLVLGHGGQIYQLDALGRFEAALVHPLRIPHGVMPFLYPPATAVAFAPLGALPYGAAFLVWLTINLLLLGATIALLLRYTALRGSDALLLGLASVSFLPGLVAISQGQVSILLLFLLTAALLAMRSGRDNVAGVLLACALIKPPCLLPILAIVLLRGRWRVVGAFGVTAITLVGLSALITGPASLTDYVRTMTSAMDWQHQIGGFAPRWNQGVAGFIQLLVPGSAGEKVGWLVSAILVGVLIWRAGRDVPFDIQFAAAVVCGLLISPHLLIHDLVLLVLPAVIAVHHRRVGPAHLTPILIGIYLAVILTLPIAALTHLQVATLSMAALFIWLLSTRRPARALSHRPEDPALRRPGPSSTHRFLARDSS